MMQDVNVARHRYDMTFSAIYIVSKRMNVMRSYDMISFDIESYMMIVGSVLSLLRQKLMHSACGLGLQDLLDFQPSLAQGLIALLEHEDEASFQEARPFHPRI